MSKRNEVTKAFRDKIQECHDNQVVVDGRIIVEQVMDLFSDQEKIEFAQEVMRGIFYDEFRRVVSATRRSSSTIVPSTSKSQAESRANKAPLTWTRWLENNGDSYNRFMEMRRPELRSAAEIRRKRGERDIHIASLAEAIADRLPNDDTRIVDAMTPEQVEELSSGISIRYSVSWTDLLGDMIRLSPPLETAAD